MIIDAHAHIGFNEIIQAAPDELLREMDRAHIDKALVLAGTMNACPTERLVRELAPYRDRLIGIGSVSPNRLDNPSLEEIEQWLTNRDIYGLKFYPGYEYFYPYDTVVAPYLELLQKTDTPAIFHSGDTFNKVGGAKLKYAHPIHIDDIAVDFPALKIVIAHLGYPWHIDAAEVVYKNANVYADCSGFVYGTSDPNERRRFSEVFQSFVDVLGSTDKILFGSDWAIPDMSDYLSLVSEVVKGDPAIMGGTCKKVFGIQ